MILGWLFIIVAIVMTVMILASAEEEPLPWACPVCYVGWERDILGQYQPWYVREDGDRVRCRRCARRFRETPNGTLVEER